MKLAMISCEKYSDCWLPFMRLVDHFWPDHPPVTLVTDRSVFEPGLNFKDVFSCGASSWCEVLAEYASTQTEEVILMQEDFLINAPVRRDLIQRGLEQMEKHGAGCVRLYPCPGGEQEYGDPHFAIVPRGARYRISCQAALWNASYLHRIASQCTTPADFEIKGTLLSDALPEPVIAFKRDVQPWPISYLCSAIGRGLWSQDAKRLCDSLQIDVDWSKRGFQAA